MNEDVELPYEYGRFGADVVVAGRSGVLSDGFGDVVIRAGEGRSVMIEITDHLSGATSVATLDAYRPIRARSNLQVDQVCESIQRAARVDGMPTPMPEPI